MEEALRCLRECHKTPALENSDDVYGGVEAAWGFDDVYLGNTPDAVALAIGTSLRRDICGPPQRTVPLLARDFYFTFACVEVIGPRADFTGARPSAPYSVQPCERMPKE